MKTKFLIPIIVVMVSCVSTVSALDLSLKQALTMAENHSLSLKASKAQSEAFHENLNAAVAERMPTLSATGLASYKDAVPHLEIVFPTGDVFQRSIGSEGAYQLDLRLSLPLYTGGRISGGIGLARATRDYYLALEQASLEEVLLLTRVEYFSLYSADRLVDAARAGLKRARVTYDDVMSLYEAGAADSVNIFDVRLAVNDAELRLTNTISVRHQSEIRLSILLGVDPSESIALSSELKAPDGNGFKPQSVLDTKPELLAAASAVEMSSSMVRLSAADMFPMVSLFGGYSWGKPNIDMFNDEFNDYFTVGANLNWSFNLGGKSLRQKTKSKHQLVSAGHEYDNTRERLDQRARLALESLKLTYFNYQSASINYGIASDNYRLASEKHRQGVLSANRLIEIETTLSQAEASLASTQADFYIVQSQYYRAIGSSLLKEGISNE